MFRCCILIVTSTLLVSVEASNNTNTSSSFNKCYYNDTSDQCASGEQCTIVPPANSTVRRRAFYSDPDSSVFNLVGSQRRKSSSSSSSKSSSSTSSSSESSSSKSTKSSSTTNYIRYGTRISRASYGTSTAGITSGPAVYQSRYYWWNKPLIYYSWRNSHRHRHDDNLAENQGICVNETELRYMTQQDCYNWCMSLEYDDSKCANDCGWSGSEGGLDKWETIAIVAVLLCGCSLWCCYGRSGTGTVSC